MKKWYSSKTIWFNLITVIVTLAAFFGFTPNPEVVDATNQAIVGVIAIANIALRFITDKGIE